MSALGCPRCAVPLFVGGASGVTMHACGACGGLWLDNAASRRLYDAMPSDALGLVDQATAHARAKIDVARRIACPVCARPLGRQPVAMAGVEVDVCGAHGTWFDRGELRAVADGMTRLRQRRPAPARAPARPPPREREPESEPAPKSSSAAEKTVATLEVAETVFEIAIGILEAF